MIHFDEEYYSFLYPDYSLQTSMPLAHYLRYGWKEGKNPSPLFNNQLFLLRNPNIIDSGLSPLEYFNLNGGQTLEDFLAARIQNESELRALKKQIEEIGYYLAYRARLFDPDYYRQNNEDLRDVTDALAHFTSNGWKEGRKYSSFMDEAAKSGGGNYLASLLFEGEGQIGLLLGLANGRLKEKALAAKVFDQEYYAAIYPAVSRRQADPFIFYMLYGWRIGHNPSEFFNTRYYQKKYGTGSQNPLFHYLSASAPGEFGAIPDYERERLSEDFARLHHNDRIAFRALHDGIFDPVWYEKAYPDIKDAGLSPFEHFRLHGVQEERNPSRAFDCSWYRATYLQDDPETLPLFHYFYSEQSPLYGNQLELLQNSARENKLLFEKLHFLQQELAKYYQEKRQLEDECGKDCQTKLPKDIQKLVEENDKLQALNASLIKERDSCLEYRQKYKLLLGIIGDELLTLTAKTAQAR